MELGHFAYRVVGYIAAFTFGNPRGRSQKQKTAYRKVRVRAAGKRPGPEGELAPLGAGFARSSAVLPKTRGRQSRRNNRRL